MEEVITYTFNLTEPIIVKEKRVNKIKEGYTTVSLGNGQLIEKTMYRAGVNEGLSEAFYANGQKSRESYYSSGLLHGVYKNWYSNGDLEFYIKYVKGNREGINICWNKNAIIEYIMFYKNDEKVNYKIWTRERCSQYKEELISKIFHPDRLERMAKLYGLDTIDYMDCLD